MQTFSARNVFANVSFISLAGVQFFALNTFCWAQTNDHNVVCDRAGFRLVIDVGHTELTPGAISASGIPEFRFNHKLAEVVADRLREAGFSKVRVEVRNREDLYERARALDAAQPHLIISIHHDSVQPKFLKTWSLDGVLRQHAEEGRFSGYSIFVSRDNQRYQDSRKFAVMLGEQLTHREHKFSTYHNEPIPGENRPLIDPDVGVFAYDRLVVLRNVRAPAVLFEAAVIANRADEEKASQESYRATIADSITQAAILFCKDLGIVKPAIFENVEARPETKTMEIVDSKRFEVRPETITTDITDTKQDAATAPEEEAKPELRATEPEEIKPETDPKPTEIAQKSDPTQNEVAPNSDKNLDEVRSSEDRQDFWRRMEAWFRSLFGARAQ